MSRQLNIGITVRRNYGAHSIEFTMSESVTVANGEQRRGAYNNLLKQLEDQVEIYEQVHLPKVNLPFMQAPNIKEEDDTFKVTRLDIEFSKGKRRVSILGGRWTMFGVACYPEASVPFDWDGHELGQHDVSSLDWTARVLMEDGKPKKVLEIVSNAQ